MEKTIKALDYLNNDFPRPRLTPTISLPFDTNNPWDSAPWPNNGLPGVYIFADEKNVFVYIGKASNSNTMSGRLGEYWRRGKNGETESKNWKSKGVRNVYTNGLPQDRPFEAPSIEEYLISKVKPERNMVGI